MTKFFAEFCRNKVAIDIQSGIRYNVIGAFEFDNYGGMNNMKLRPSRHLVGLTKEISFDDFSDSAPPLRVSKSYCANSDLFRRADIPCPRDLPEDEYKRQAELLRRHCSR